ncbi:carbohydrate ABC transporter permease [Paenibacillus psychroresistens]|uniref:Carbohydrate ABC transporter permease n=1 Tax=Paenibacillus psychroresistens TaxID=1778678 RepID=A0A6B8RFP0_9BACL|nr:carbohydrate ABC transporter permease [Paenibacillus psychroresistens]QGQ94312.1 carbohydrate ABC transporter permease [Paenibacillus psychroresistens]
MNEFANGKLKSKKRYIQTMNIITLVAVIFIAFLVLFPIWWIFRTSLMTNPEIYKFPPSLFPPNWLFSNYEKTLEVFKFWKYLWNTMLIIVPACLGGTLTATLCGYAFARLRFRGKQLIWTLCVGSMLLPTMVTLIPLYIGWTRGVGLHDSYLPLILPYFCGGGAFNIFLIRQFIISIPRELDQAATIDGAGYFRILFNIIVPVIKPAMIVVALFIFIGLWNDLLQQMIYINSSDKFTIALGLTNFKGQLKSDWSMTMAATCMSFAPGVIFYLIGQKYFVEGITMTGIKN